MTEAEWEKAARGPEGFLFPWGDGWDATQANVKESGLRGTAAVGSYPSNGYFDIVEISPLSDLNDVSGHTAVWLSLYVMSGIVKDEFNLK